MKEVVDKMIKKFKHIKYKIKESVNWTKTFINRKYFFTQLEVKDTIRYIAYGIVIIIALVALLCILNIIGIENGDIVIKNIKELNKDKFHSEDYVIAQISITLIVVSVVSLMANLENKFMYGEKIIEVIFPKNGLLSIKWQFIYLFIAMILNILAVIKDYGDTIILVNFIFTMFITIYMTYKFTMIYVSPQQIKQKLLYKYWKDYKKQIVKGKTRFDDTTIVLERFKNITIKHICENNPQNIENINAYLIILDKLLFNYANELQEYYTETHFNRNILSDIMSFSREFLKQGNMQQALAIYNEVYRKLRYYKVVVVNDYARKNLLCDFIAEYKNIEKETEAINIHREIWESIILEMFQSYLYMKNDLSYCRLEKIEMLYTFHNSNLISDYYIAIRDNKNLTDKEKEAVYFQLYESMRMYECDEEKIGRNNIDSFFNSKMYYKEKNEIPLTIKAEPISLLFLKMFENQDYKNIKMFLTMNLSEKTMSFIRALTSLSIVSILYKENKREYFVDLDIDETKTKYKLKEFRFNELPSTDEELEELYQYIVRYYSKENIDKNNKNRQYTKEKCYGFNPKFDIKEEVIKNYFYIIFKNRRKESEFLKLNQMEQYIPNEKIKNIMEEIT